MKNPLVSVIIPNYNHARFLDDRIQSVLNQTYQNFEVIILDDKSTDNSVEVINKYNPHVSHIVVNEENSGSPFKQWHKGFELAKGEWIWIAESDDYCKSVFLEECILRLNSSNNTAIVFCTSLLVDTTGKPCVLKDVSENIPDGCVNGHFFIKRYMLKRNSIWNASAVLFKKYNAIHVKPIYMDYKAAGDHLFWCLLAEHGDVVHVAKHLNYFRQHNVKVTPYSFLDGTIHFEELKTIKYLVERGYLGFFRKIMVFRFYYRQLLSFGYNSESVRKRLIDAWNDAIWIPAFVFKLDYLFNNMYQRLRHWIFVGISRFVRPLK